MPAVQSLIFDSLLAQGRRNQLRFCLSSIQLTADFAKEHPDTIFQGIAAAAAKSDKYLASVKDHAPKKLLLKISIKVMMLVRSSHGDLTHIFPAIR